MISLLEVLNRTRAFFSKHEIAQAKLDAELILAHVLGCRRLDLYLQFERPLTEDELERIRPLVRRRSRREPLQYILGAVEFYGLSLACDPRALIPRPETEELVDRLVTRGKEAGRIPARILDLGTGTGAIALSLAAAYPQSKVVATDESADALDLARENAARNEMAERIEFVHTSWLSGMEERFDLIVSNPPYLARSELGELAPEVKDHEPVGALVSGDSGREDLEHLISHAKEHLDPGGMLALETGPDQHEALKQRSLEEGYAAFESEKDLSGRDRFVFLSNPS